MEWHNKNISLVCSDKPQLSVVIPAFNEHSNLRPLYNELLKVLNLLEMQWEIIIVDDGSKDDTWQEIKSIHSQDKRVRGLKFTRNFGHQNALFAGLQFSRGRAVISMDADLQHPPEVILQMVEEWRKGYKIVQTARIDNKNISLAKKITSKLYYKIFSFLCGVNISEGMADFRLLDRQVIEYLVQNKEVALFLRGLVEWLGFKSSKITFQCNDRHAGESKYSLKKMLKLASAGIIRFSIIPLRLGIILGILSSSFAFYQLTHAFYIRLFTDKAVQGWASTVGIMSLLFGILFIFLGVIGEYIGRILIQVQGRNRYVINETTDAYTSQ